MIILCYHPVLLSLYKWALQLLYTDVQLESIACWAREVKEIWTKAKTIRWRMMGSCSVWERSVRLQGAEGDNAAVNSDKKETCCCRPPVCYLLGPFPADRRRDSGQGLKWICRSDEATDALLGALRSPLSVLLNTEEGGDVGEGWQRGGVAGWQRAKAQPLAMGLGNCLCASDLKSTLFSPLVNVMKKEGKKKFS